MFDTRNPHSSLLTKNIEFFLILPYNRLKWSEKLSRKAQNQENCAHGLNRKNIIFFPNSDEICGIYEEN